jgi:glycosyltransferase involved in cell wall biosynthesis
MSLGSVTTGPVAVVTATDTGTRDSGKKVVVGGMIDHLCARLGPERVHVVLVASAGAPYQPVPYHLHVLDRPSSPEQLWSLLSRTVVQRRSSLQEAALHSGRLAASLAAVLDQIDPQLEVWDTVRLGQLAPMVRRRHRVLYLDDLYSQRYTSMLDALASGASDLDPLGAFADQLPSAAARLVASPRVARRLLRLERRLVARAEDHQPAGFDASFLLSAEETAILRARTGIDSIHTLLPILPSRTPQPRTGTPGSTFGFLGALFYGPNADGLRWFLTTCRDAVLRAVPDFRLLVIGRGSEVVRAAAAPWGDRVELLGWVPDLDEVLRSCAALVAPLRVGSGAKLKVLEALSRGLPVVATPMGVQGLGVDDSDGCLVAAEPDGLAAALARASLLADNDQLSAAAREAWSGRFSPDAVTPAYDRLFGLTSRADVTVR